MPSRMIDALLTELDPLSYRQRQRLLAGRAHELAADGRLQTMAGETADVFERELVLFMATVIRDSEIVATALGDESWRLRAQAVKACRHVPVDHQRLVALLGDAPWEMRKRIYKLVRRERLTELADRLLPVAVQRFDDSEAAALLPACSAEVVERELPALAHAVENWAVMALAHPAAFLAWTRRELAGATTAARQRWWWRHGAGVLALAGEDADAVFGLLEDHPAESYPHGLGQALAVLARRDPIRVFTLLDRPESGFARRTLTEPCLLRTVRSLPVAWLAGFVRRHGFGINVRDLVLGALPPARRAELFDHTREHFQQPGYPTPESTLAVLPHTVRVAEARRSLALARVCEDEGTTLRYTAYLPFDEAEVALLKATGRHLADERAVGYELLLKCAARSNDAPTVSRALGMLTRLRNEQDPVRARTVNALSDLPVRLFTADQVPVLAEVTRDAVAARDASMATRDALGRLAVRMLAHRSDAAELLGWAVSTLDELFGTGRLPSFGRLDLVLRHGQEQEFFTAVRPWIEAGTARANFWPLFTTARALGRRAWWVDELQALLGAAIHQDNTTAVNREAIDLWLGDPGHRSQRVQTVLLDDASTVALPVVWQTLSTLRTDLLDLVLEGGGPTGKHLAAGVRWVPGHAPRIDRWLPRQHRRYLDLLTRVAADAGADLNRRVMAIRAAASIPVIGWSLVTKYCGSANTVLDEAALGALIWTDRPAEALPILLSHVDDDRARVAVYALSRAVRFMAPSAIRPVLVGVLQQARKVTSRKEAIRLVSAVAPRDAMTEIITAWHPQQHRDVRVAIVNAARWHLHEPQSWQVLDDAAGDPERAVAQAAIQVTPSDVPTMHRQRYAGLIRGACQHTDPAVARMAWTWYPRWAAWSPGALDDITDAVCDLNTLTTWRTAMDALINLLDDGFTARQLAPAFERLLRCDADGPDAEIDRDHPARQRLIALAHKVMSWTQRHQHRMDRADIAALGEVLIQQSEYLGTGLELMMWSMAIDESVTDRLTSLSVMTEGRPLAAQTMADTLLARLNRERDRLSLDQLHETAMTLARGDSFASGLLALTIVKCAATSPSGWAAPRDRHLLRTLRRHQHADIRELAHNQYSSAE